MGDHACKYAVEYEKRASEVLNGIVDREGDIRHAWLGPILSDAYKLASETVITAMFNSKIDSYPTFKMFVEAREELSDEQYRTWYEKDIKPLMEDDFRYLLSCDSN